MSTTIGGVRIVDMPDLGAITDDSSVVGEHAGSGRFGATAFRSYIAVDAAIAPSFNNSGRNLLHNPLFNVQQRGRGPWTTGNSYTADRWLAFAATDAIAVTLGVLGNADRVQIGDEQASFGLSYSFVGNPAFGAYTQLTQKVEDVTRLAGKTVTVSFWAQPTSAALKLGINIMQNFGTGGSPSAPAWAQATGVSITLEHTVWTRYYVTLTLPSVSTMTLGTNADHRSEVTFWFSSGGTFSQISGFVGIQSGTVNLWGIQLEISSAATPLEKPDPRYDLSNCQRFFETAGFVNQTYQAAGQNIAIWSPFMVTKRATPTIAFNSMSYGNGSGVMAQGQTVAGSAISWTATALGPSYAIGTYVASADL
jgi:hypothetical protein